MSQAKVITSLLENSAAVLDTCCKALAADRPLKLLLVGSLAVAFVFCLTEFDTGFLFWYFRILDQSARPGRTRLVRYLRSPQRLCLFSARYMAMAPVSCQQARRAGGHEHHLHR